MGQFDRALTINTEVGTTNKPDIMIFVARQYLKRGEQDKASLLLPKAVSASAKITADNLQQFARFDATVLLTEAGLFDQALRMVNATDAQSPRIRLLTHLAPLFARAGRIAVAEKLLSEAYQLTRFSKGTYFQAGDIREVADAYAAIGKKVRAEELLTEAAAVLNSLEDPTNRELVFGEIVESYLKLGDDEKALQITERMGDGSGLKGLTLLRIASKISGADQLMKERERIVEELMRP